MIWGDSLPMAKTAESLVSLQVRLPQALLDRIDTHRASVKMRPSRSQVIRFLLENAMTVVEEKERGP
jgi:Arc/MetJ-type ribon-helix-helix transcriptional regulator